MPDSDRKIIKYEFLQQQVKLALKAREDNDWAKKVPMDLFMNYVLPYASLDEPREDWRSLFYDKFSPLVKGTDSLLEAAREINYRIWDLDGWNITFKAEQTPEIMSPSQVLSHGYASCTGLSIFNVNALRAVGIPARVAGTPEWVGSGGNHDWVEVWADGVWSFFDAIRQPFNQTWFFPDPVRWQVSGSFKHAVYAASFKPTPKGIIFPLAWRDDYESVVPGYDVTKYYVKAAQDIQQQQAQEAAEVAVGGSEGQASSQSRRRQLIGGGERTAVGDVGAAAAENPGADVAPGGVAHHV
ncbi:hypothetical protein CHLRE_16g653150v5 [Chlamydomonas reinhardtii]|uniref:Transglutaminase-like domain-containing protein n=2 Tax=Chlamydomonas reinhardtii TaxID=3055 RepID=A0A2K3CSZ8_CHLRE|nr:uncharacterized protein CHLRE_16g653150v5 [Chlamydomonas reinhardtii]PNW71410.1 hypothetical protein CHLRE_16g653150v5 [Chlamydomonas reinhardtii]